MLVKEVLNRSARPVPITEQLQTNLGLINELVNYDNTILDKPYKEVLKSYWDYPFRTSAKFLQFTSQA